ncbi:ARP4 [Candida oxycetoniae]|uniref:ARP4 n=1 Tax=Candida oxycetoniae TaxID=497107 RepID=A0AAI9SYS2_9ASCO|nr:ARP4 [Candida oxycetoniae]KAI3404990.2 ARP4 [Candida oxycetoniae]
MSTTNANTVYGGDEINAIILDIGSLNTRIGYAGDDFPKIITASSYGQLSDGTRIFGESIDVLRQKGTEVKRIVENSLIVDWEAAFEMFSYYFKQLKIVEKDQPILITEPIWSTNEYRTRLIEQVYKRYEFPGLYLVKVPSCISFQQGRPNCLVVDLGHDSISVSPVVDGICLIKSSVRTPYSGKFLNNIVKDFLQGKKKTSSNGEGEEEENRLVIEPSILIKNKEPTKYPQEKAVFELKKLGEDVIVTDSFRLYEEDKIWHEFKETMLEVPTQEMKKKSSLGKGRGAGAGAGGGGGGGRDCSDDDSDSPLFSKRTFELPTGQSITLGQERFLMAETIFDPLLYKFNQSELQPPACNGEIPGIEHNTISEYRPVKRIRRSEDEENDVVNKKEIVRGLTQLITHVISIIDIDLRAGLANNIIVTGGSSLIVQLTERLYHELSQLNPGLKIRLHATGNSMERINQSWIGASVLASLGTFHQMWVSQREYEMEGSERILNQRFR